MSYARYLAAVNNALREIILPELHSGRAKDAAYLGISVLGAIAASLETVAPELLISLDEGLLPESLKAFFPVPQQHLAGIDPGLSLPLSGPANDLALNKDALPLLKAGAAWLTDPAWVTEPELNKSAMALLQWETGLRNHALFRVQSAEQGLSAEKASAAVADINAPALEAYLRKRFKTDEIHITEFRFLTGGRSHQTAFFMVAGIADIPTRLVIQREHPGKITTLSGINMEYRVLEQAHATGMKVPRPVMLELSPAPLGAAFMIMEYVKGASAMSSMESYWSPPARSDRLAASLAGQLAMVHRIPIGKLTGVMARHVDPHKGRTWLTDIDELELQLKTMAIGPSMAVSAGIAWMRAHLACIDDRVAIVHNDTLLHNLLVEDDEITAVLDWEMAHIGHPFEDLGYVRPVVEQMTDWNRFLNAYVDAGGQMPTSEQVNFFTLRAILKLLVQTMHARGAFDSCRTNDLTMAEVGASFTPKLINRLAEQVNNIVGWHVT